MEKGLIKHISIISGIVAHNFTNRIIIHLNANYYQGFEIISEITQVVYKKLEDKLDNLEPIEYLQEVVKETKNILLKEYRINLIAHAS